MGKVKTCFFLRQVLLLLYVLVILLSASLQVPPPNKGFLHIRPLLIGSGPVLSLTPAPEFIFLILVTPMGDYSRVNCLIYVQTNLCFGVVFCKL